MFRNSLLRDCVALSKGFNLVRRNSAISLSSSFSLKKRSMLDYTLLVNRTVKGLTAMIKSLLNEGLSSCQKHIFFFAAY